jgi:hypothetical protein
VAIQEVFMIGTVGQQNIVLAYSVPNYADLPQDARSALASVKEHIEAFTTTVRTQIGILKDRARTDKANLEAQKNQNSKDMAETAFHNYLFKKGDGYIARLRTIGLTSNAVWSALNQNIDQLAQRIRQANGSRQKAVDFRGAKYFKFDIRKTVNSKVLIVALSPGQPTEVATLFEIITDAASAYTPTTVEGSVRPVFSKKNFLDPSEQSTQYVMDDDGVYTRRYAVLHKRRSALKMLLDNGYLRGRYAPMGAKSLGENEALQEDPNIFKVQDFETVSLRRDAGTNLNLRQMLHVHQELGSGNSARGMCLTSVSISGQKTKDGTWKNNLKTMYSNPGPAFGNDDKTVLVLVDLAKVPENQQLLYNLYRPDAQAKAQSVTIYKENNEYRDNTHMLDSVSKNREIFLRVLVPSFVVNYQEVKQETEAGDWETAGKKGKAKAKTGVNY